MQVTVWGRDNSSSSQSGGLCDKDTGSVAELCLLCSNTTGTFGRVIESVSISQLVAATCHFAWECMLPLFIEIQSNRTLNR